MTITVSLPEWLTCTETAGLCTLSYAAGTGERTTQVSAAHLHDDTDSVVELVVLDILSVEHKPLARAAAKGDDAPTPDWATVIPARRKELLEAPRRTVELADP